MENKNMVKQNILILAVVLFLPFCGVSQIKIKIEIDQLSVSDTLDITIENATTKKGYYNIAWEVFERNKWRIMRTDIFSNFPMAMGFQNIVRSSNCWKYFVIDNIFTGTFKKYNELPSRLVLTYSYSKELEPRRIIYSDKFIVKAKPIKSKKNNKNTLTP